MVGQILHIQIGQCGNQIGYDFWEMVSEEYGLNYRGICQRYDEINLLDRVDVFYHQALRGVHVPRAILVDLDSSSLDNILSKKYGRLFCCDNIFYGHIGSGDNYRKGYNYGGEILEPVLDIVRKEAESCDWLQGFQFVHSICGGTGSGFTSLLLESIRDDFPDKIFANYTHFPEKGMSDTVVEPHNGVLGLKSLYEYSDIVFCFDNRALFQRASLEDGFANPTYNDVNKYVARVMDDVTYTMRFPGYQVNSDMRRLAINLIPYTHQQFLIPSLASPMYKSNNEMNSSESCINTDNNNWEFYEKVSKSLGDVVTSLFNMNNALISVDPKSGIYHSVLANFRGNTTMKEIEDLMSEYQRTNSSNFSYYIPSNFILSLKETPVNGGDTAKTPEISATSVGNSCSMIGYFERLKDLNLKMIDRNYWKYNIDLDVSLFEESLHTLGDLLGFYYFYNDFYQEGEDENEDEIEE